MPLAVVSVTTTHTFTALMTTLYLAHMRGGYVEVAITLTASVVIFPFRATRSAPFARFEIFQFIINLRFYSNRNPSI